MNSMDSYDWAPIELSENMKATSCRCPECGHVCDDYLRDSIKSHIRTDFDYAGMCVVMSHIPFAISITCGKCNNYFDVMLKILLLPDQQNQ